MKGVIATKKGLSPGFAFDASQADKIELAGGVLDQRSPHHVIISRSPWIECWPSKSKYRIGKDGAVLMASWPDFLADVQEALRGAQTSACAICGRRVAEEGRKHHDKCLIKASYAEINKREMAWAQGRAGK